MDRVRVGDTVMYKQRSDEPPRHGISIHPAIITNVIDEVAVDLMVFWHNWMVAPQPCVIKGDADYDGECWWERT